MASSVTYNIKGKYDGKATKQAKSDLKSLSDTVKQVTGVIKGLAVVKGISEIIKFANASKGVYIEQNKALTNFNTAVQKSNIETSKLLALQTKISHNNFIDNDSINNAMALGLQMGLNEEQLNKVMEASSELASAGVMPLDQAVKTLSQTYTGTSGTLGKLLPDVKNLTAAELQQGEAVEEVLTKYSGYSDAMSKTFSGRSTQWKNSVDDLKASIGTFPTAFEFLTQGKLLEPLNKLTEWLTNNRNAIINFFVQFPSVARSVIDTVKTMLRKTVENLPEIISQIGPMIVQTAKDAFQTFFEVAKACFNGIGELLDFVIGNPFRSSKDFVNKFLNNIIEGINDLPQHLPNWLKDVIGIDQNTEIIKFRFSTNNSDNNKTFEETAKGISESITKASESFKSGTDKIKKDWLKVIQASGDIYGEDIEALKTSLKEIFGQDLPEDLKMALEGITYTPEGNSTTNNDEGLGGDTTKEVSIKDTVLSGTGEIGSLIKAYLDSGWKGVIVELLSKISSILTSASDVISNALNSVTYILNQILPPIVKILENWLGPILGFLRSIGEIIGNILKIFEPIQSIVGGTIIKTVLSVIIVLLDSIYNVVVALHNIFTSNKKDWSYRNINSDVESIQSANSTFDTSAALTSSNASSSYTQARDIYVNIIFNQSYVNGDADAIALNIRDRIREAEAMGY